MFSIPPDSAETITEVTDLEEVERIAGLCQRTQENSSTTAFRNVLSQFASQPAEEGYFGTGDALSADPDAERAAASLKKLGIRSS